jgi:hypothetical protein
MKLTPNLLMELMARLQAGTATESDLALIAEISKHMNKLDPNSPIIEFVKNDK